MDRKLSVVMLGATGAVGSQAAQALAGLHQVERLTLLGRRRLDSVSGEHIAQYVIDIFDRASYRTLLPGHRIAICTLGVGQPSSVSRADFLRIDKQAVLDFAAACKAAGVQHFELLSSVGASSRSPSFFLRSKGDLEDGLRALDFERLSLFHPSMIITPENRYGFWQGVTLAVWPVLSRFMLGPAQKLRGIPVETLGRAFAANILTRKEGAETLHWHDIAALGGR